LFDPLVLSSILIVIVIFHVKSYSFLPVIRSLFDSYIVHSNYY